MYIYQPPTQLVDCFVTPWIAFNELTWLQGCNETLHIYRPPTQLIA